MKSNTITPLLQLTEWFGIDPWKANGIDRDNPKKPQAKCQCLFEESWVKPTQWSRQDLIGMLDYAEQVFLWETGAYVGTKQILEDDLEYYGKNYKYGNINTQKQYKSVKPTYSSKLQEFGSYILEFVDLITLDTSNLEYFTATSNVVPADTELEELFVFFTQADADYIGDPEYGDHSYEIRPIRVKSLSGTNFEARIPTYLLRKPEFDNHTNCLTHELDTYVEEVLLYKRVRVECGDGYYVSENGSICDNNNCNETLNQLCLGKRLVGKEFWAVPKPINCEGQPYCVLTPAESVRINYLTGFKELVSGDIQKPVNEIVMKLTVGLADCIKGWCPCEGCAESKLKYYRKVEKEKIEDTDPTVRGMGNRFQLLLHPSTLQLLAGYPLYRGLTMAYREMLKLGLNTVEGSHDGF